MKALILQLTLETPALFTGVNNGEENSSRSLPYIPGAALRGLLVSRYIEKHQPAFDLPADKTAQQLFFDGSVRFLNAYPVCDSTWTRGLPAPASWRKRKNEELDKAQACDYALNVDVDFDTSIQRAFTGAYDDGVFIVFNPEGQLITHIGGEERGRVKKGNNAVFQYRSIAKGQSFVAVILTEDDKHLKTIQSLLEQDSSLRIGRSHSASYGLVRVENITTNDDWHEFKKVSPEGLTTITLLSDALLRDENGQPTHDLDLYLSENLGKPVKHVKAFVHSVITGGFNRKWKLPLPQFPALGMGSVFVYDAGQVTEKELEPLVVSGIGERRVEGFGRIAVNWQGRGSFTLRKKEEKPAKLLSVSLCESSKILATSMAERLLRQKLDSKLVAQARRYEIKGRITNHQLARLRGVVRDAINCHNSDVSKVQDFLNKLKPIALKQFEKPRLNGGMKLNLWLAERLKEKDGLQLIGLGNAELPAVAGQKPNQTAYVNEYTLRFIEAVIDKRMKEKE